MIYGAVHESRGYGNHQGYDIVAFTVKLPEVQHTVDATWVSVYVVASKNGINHGVTCEAVVRDSEDVSALDNVPMGKLILEAVADANGEILPESA